MDKDEITNLMKLPFPELAKVCRNPETLATVLSLAVGIGIKTGREQTHRFYNQMFAGHNEVSIRN